MVSEKERSKQQIIVSTMKNIVKALSIITFLSATTTVASIFYEGMVLKWFDFVGVSILITDMLFLIATVAGVFYFRGDKTLFYSHLFSCFVILTGIIIILIYGKEIPKFLFMLWEFYILYFYGIVVCKQLWQRTT
jgi:hypothetical protein